MTLWRSPLAQLEPTPESWQLLYNELIFELVAIVQLCNCQRILPAFLLAHCQHTASLPLGCTNKVAAKKNSTLANMTSLRHSWSHTCRIIINCRNSRIYKTCYIYKKQCVILFSIYLSGFHSLATSNPLLFRRKSSLPFTHKKESQRGVGQCMVTFPEENFPSVFPTQ